VALKDNLSVAGHRLTCGSKILEGYVAPYTATAVERLLAAGANAKQLGPNGETMVMFAARNGNPEIIKLLVKAGADVNAKEKVRGTTALMWAAEQRHPEAVKMLLELGADPAQIGYGEMTALHAAAGARGKSFLRILLDSGVSPDLQDGRTQAPVLAQALMTGNRDAVQLLLAHRANPNLADRSGDTPLHVAAQISDYASLLALLQAGADPTIRNRAGKTFAPYFAITPKESMLNAETKAARQAVRDWLDGHGYAEVLQ